MRAGPAATAAASFGRMWVAYRIRAGLTQQEVAGRAGLSVRGVRNLELGATARPRRRTISSLLDIFEIDEAGRFLIERHLRSMRAVPRRPNGQAIYVGRQLQLAHLESFVEPATRGGPNAIVVVGAPGSGKTALVAQAVSRLQSRFPDGQIFLSLDRETDDRTVLARALWMLGVPGAEIPATLEERVETYRSLVAGRRLLIVGDGADARQARALRPGATASILIVSSKSRLGSLGETPRVIVPSLTTQEGVQLLAGVLGAERVEREERAAREIVDHCAGLPSAIKVAGGRLRDRPHRSLAELAGRLVTGEGRRAELLVGDSGIRASLTSACSELSAPARMLLGRLGQLSRPEITPWWAATAMRTSVDDAEDLLDELANLHLIEPAPPSPGRRRHFLVHGLVQSFAAEIGELVAQRCALVEQPPPGALRSGQPGVAQSRQMV